MIERGTSRILTSTTILLIGVLAGFLALRVPPLLTLLIGFALGALVTLREALRMD